jgi:hypothetical protein
MGMEPYSGVVFRSALCLTVFISLMLPAGGCTFLGNLLGGGSTQGQPGQATAGPTADDQMLEQIELRRQRVESSPGDLSAALDYAQYIQIAASQGMYERTNLTATEEVGQAVAALQAVEGSDDELSMAKTMEAALHATLGDTETQGALLEEAYALSPKSTAFEALAMWHGSAGNDDRVVELCEETREGLEYEHRLLVVLDTCMKARGATSIETGLDFASKGDRAWYESEMARAAAEHEARLAAEREQRAREQAQRDAERAAQAEARAAAAQSQSAPGGSAASGPVSVTIRSSCRETVKVFYGDKPKYGSGTQSSISGNSRQSHSFRPGDMFWIVDSSGNGMSSVTVNPGMREIEILSSCTGMSSR